MNHKKLDNVKINLTPIKGKEEKGVEPFYKHLPFPKPDDWYVYKDGKRYLNDKYF